MDNRPNSRRRLPPRTPQDPFEFWLCAFNDLIVEPFAALGRTALQVMHGGDDQQTAKRRRRSGRRRRRNRR
ncbi:MAG: hypothetical protein GY842_19800 [bacterium]|nr:hypothetical protein [bacterium]